MIDVFTLKVASETVNDDAVSLIKETLERAEKGEVIAVAIVEVRKARTVATAFSKSHSYHELNSGAARLAASLASAPDED